jgi:hypothetical protein
MQKRVVQKIAIGMSLAGCAAGGYAQQTGQTTTAPMAATAPTAVPALVPFSGAALDSQGKPLAGEMSATFLIYKDQQGGEPLFAETQMVSFDAAGHYKVQLGAANSNGLPSELFATGEARWLEVQIAGQPAAPRVLIASVPYALKAADAATLGGLPASAFMLAGSNGLVAGATPNAVTPDTATTVTTTGGAANYVAKFSGANTIVNSILYDNGTQVGINTNAPSATLTVGGTLSVSGGSTLNGAVLINPAGTATASTAYDSQQLKLYASAYNSSSKAVNTPHFIWQAEPTGNNTASPGATLNLLAATANNGAAETGFYLNSNGTIHFATGQTFPGGSGTGTITGVTAGAGLTGGGTSGNVTLSLNTGTVPTLAGNNSFTGSNTFVPSLYADKDVNIDNTNANPGNISPGLRLGQASGEGMSSKRTSGGNQFGVDIYTDYLPRLSINASGQVAIGTGATFGGAQFQVQGQGGQEGGYFLGASGADGIVAYGGADNSSSSEGFGGYGGDFFGGQAEGTYAYGGLGGLFEGGSAYSSNAGGEGGWGAEFIGGYSNHNGGGGYGLYAAGGDGSDSSGSTVAYAGNFSGNVNITGSISSSAKTIKIDDPSDPANKYLVHSAVASSEQMNLYSGNVTTDNLGVATVTLPTWFQDLNTDFRYQLTVVGGRFAQAIVSKEIANNQFTISTNASGVKVSWQVTAVRQDAYAKANPLVVEQAKGPKEIGFYVHPELYGQPKEKQTEWGLHPQMMARLKAARVARPASGQTSQSLPKAIAKSGGPQ